MTHGFEVRTGEMQCHVCFRLAGAPEASIGDEAGCTGFVSGFLRWTCLDFLCREWHIADSTVLGRGGHLESYRGIMYV